jgi:hypothetical protein
MFMVVLFTKPNFGMGDMIYKIDALEEISKMVAVAFSSDNEPVNLNRMIDQLSRALCILKSTILYDRLHKYIPRLWCFIGVRGPF